MGVIIDFFFHKREKPKTREKIILNVGPGGMFSIRNYGHDMEDIDVQVTARHMYSQGDSCWYELEGTASNGKKIFLEIDMDDELILSASLPDKIKLKDLGIDKSDLEEIDDEEEGEVKYNGKVYEYEDSDDACFHRDEDEDSEQPFYYFDFLNEESNTNISIAIWDRGGSEVTLSQIIREDQIDVLSLGEENEEEGD